MRCDQQTTEATDVETKETLLLFLCLCARTRRASHNGGGNEEAPTGLPPGLAAVMPLAIFASLTADWQQAEESLAATRYDSVLDILASDSSILSAYLALLLDKLDGTLPHRFSQPQSQR
jgi:phosphatidylserine synthase